MRRRLSAFTSASSSGSTNAPRGTSRKMRPIDLTSMFPTLVRMPCAPSWITIATIRPRMPYHSGMIGFTPGIPSISSRPGALSAGIWSTRVASQSSRAIIRTMTMAHTHFATAP